MKDQIKTILQELGSATADEVVRELEARLPEDPEKPLIAGAHAALTELHQAGEINAKEENGNLVYSAK